MYDEYINEPGLPLGHEMPLTKYLILLQDRTQFITLVPKKPLFASVRLLFIANMEKTYLQ